MELRLYWSIIRRRLWLVLLLALVAFGISAVHTPRSSASYTASVKLAVKPQMNTLSEDYGEYYPYVASEFLNDDVGKVIEGGAFMSQLRARAEKERGSVPGGYFETKKAHRVMTVSAISNNPDDALLLSRIAVEMLTEPRSPYFETISAQNPQVTVVDPPAITGSTPAGRIGLDIVIRTLLGLFAGIALAFLLDYLDDTVRGQRDLEDQAGLAVLGEIPQ